MSSPRVVQGRTTQWFFQAMPRTYHFRFSAQSSPPCGLAEIAASLKNMSSNYHPFRLADLVEVIISSGNGFLFCRFCVSFYDHLRSPAPISDSRAPFRRTDLADFSFFRRLSHRVFPRHRITTCSGALPPPFISRLQYFTTFFGPRPRSTTPLPLFTFVDRCSGTLPHTTISSH